MLQQMAWGPYYTATALKMYQAKFYSFMHATRSTGRYRVKTYAPLVHEGGHMVCMSQPQIIVSYLLHFQIS